MWLRKKVNKTVRKSDSIYASPLDKLIDFRFDEHVVDVFPDMIQRSVPGYATIISMIGVFAEKYAQQNSHCYDLGCSLGAASLSMQQKITRKDCDIIAVDNSQAMIERAQQIFDLENEKRRVPVQLICANIQDIDIKKASVVVMNFTLQFIPLAERLQLIKQIYQGLEPDGILVLSEKITLEEHSNDQFQNESHHNFKRANGYSDLEISQKRTALENVLIPETLTTHQQRLTEAGFTSSNVWFQCFNFMSLVAIK
jgi:tRNA (cmo5U34)-methyltransferase